MRRERAEVGDLPCGSLLAGYIWIELCPQQAAMLILSPNHSARPGLRLWTALRRIKQRCFHYPDQVEHHAGGMGVALPSRSYSWRMGEWQLNSLET